MLAGIPAFEAEPEALIELFGRLKALDPEVKFYDHRIFFSIYIKDPNCTRLEFMSLQHEKVAKLLKERGIPSSAINPAVSEWKKPSN